MMRKNLISQQAWSKATGAAIGIALILMLQGIAHAEAAAAQTTAEMSEEALIEVLNATASEMGLGAAASVTRSAGPGQHTILQVYSEKVSFDITLYDALDLGREAYEKGFVGKENHPFDFHGYPAVEVTYAAGNRGPIHGLMIHLGKANFRVIARRPDSPDAVRNVAEIFRRHAAERGLMK
jgi:hypothetical protein